MADVPVIDVDAEEVEEQLHSPKVPKMDERGGSRTTAKRKKIADSSAPENAGEKEARVEELEKELNDLFRYYKELKSEKVSVELSECGSRNSMIAVLMEESELPLSELVEVIYDRLMSAGSGVVALEKVTHTSVKNTMVSVGQRIAYGLPNDEADILEDHSESCLWCWETRDEKLIPESVRGQFIVRRICRGRIHKRIVAVSEMISSLKKPESEQSYNHGLIKASSMLCKVYNEADIRLLVRGLTQIISLDMDMKKAKREENLLLKQLDTNRREVEEKGSKMLRCGSGEASKDKSCNSKDVCENKNQKNKQPVETERDRRRREKEESELKKKLSLQKQASIMESFLKRFKPSQSFQNDQLPSKSVVCESATLSMDSSLASGGETTLENIRKSHFSLWRDLGKSIHSNEIQKWGTRRKPKSELSKELKLVSTHYGQLRKGKHEDRLGEHSFGVISDLMNADNSLLGVKKYVPRKQLLQFDNSPRPAFYGIWPTKSQVVGPRHPFRKEPSLDYDVNSEEEWEEEASGESISDSDKDEEECSISDYESDDGYFVPDGFLSESEGAQVVAEGVENLLCGKDVESDEFCALLRQQKFIDSLTEIALKKNRPLIVTNLMHDKELGTNFCGILEPEKMFLQSLSMLLVSTDHLKDEDQGACLSAGKGAALVSDVNSKLGKGGSSN